VGGRDSAAAVESETSAQSRMNGVTLDGGALIALDRNDRRVIALLARAREIGARITIPATALAQAVRHPSRQARLSRLARQSTTEVVALDGADAPRVGLLLAARRRSDIVDAHVVICARRNAQAIVTSDPDDLAHLDPEARLIVV
jgi:predicted nucleic acid-binding protein